MRNKVGALLLVAGITFGFSTQFFTADLKISPNSRVLDKPIHNKIHINEIHSMEELHSSRPQLSDIVQSALEQDLVSENMPNLPPFDVVVVGAGLSGAVIAERHASMLGKRVLIVEKRDHIGGNCYDYLDPDTGIRVNKYGAHLFHTNSEEVWNYIRKFSDWSPWEHKVLGYVKSKYIPVPVNIDTVNSLFNLTLSTSSDMQDWLKNKQIQMVNDSKPTNSEEMTLSRVGRDLYELIFKPYTEKQWNISVSQLGPEVTGRIPVRDNFDDRYFSDKYQVLPRHGYTSFFHSMISTNPLIEVHTSTDYFDMQPELRARIPPSTKIFYTGPIDRFFLSKKRLQYRSLKFSRVVKYNQSGFCLPAPVVNYPGKEFPFTRVVEYKHMLNQPSGSSVLFYEFPSDIGEPYYPIPTIENKALYSKLLKMTSSIPNVTFVGRLANYKYFNMDEAISNALHVFRTDSCLPTAEIHVITSVFNENLDWQETLCNLLGFKTVRWFVFDKSGQNRLERPQWIQSSGSHSCTTLGWHVAPLPNVGREGHSWLTYIQTGIFAKTNAFFQGKPEGSLSDLADIILLHHKDEEQSKIIPMPSIYSSKIICPPTDDPWFDSDDYHSELLLLADYLKIPLEKMCRFYRGQFVASFEALEHARTNHTAFIGNVIMPALESGNNPPMGFALERSWVHILGGK